jgi:hypothetical protein
MGLELGWVVLRFLCNSDSTLSVRLVIVKKVLDESSPKMSHQGLVATLGPEEKPILSQRDEGWAVSVALFSSCHPASHPASQPPSQPADHPSFYFEYLSNHFRGRSLIFLSQNSKLIRGNDQVDIN